MVFNTTFNNISVILWRLVLLVEETGVTVENHQPVVSHWQIYHIMLYQVHLAMSRIKLTMLVVISTDCIDSCKSNYHMITTMTASETWNIVYMGYFYHDKWAIFHLYHGENKLHLMRWWWFSLFTRPTCLVEF